MCVLMLTNSSLSRYSHVTFTGCTAHALDLLLEDICKLPWAKELKEEAMSIIHFITNHHKSLALFRSLAKQHANDKQLRKPGMQQLPKSAARCCALLKHCSSTAACAAAAMYGCGHSQHVSCCKALAKAAMLYACYTVVLLS